MLRQHTPSAHIPPEPGQRDLELTHTQTTLHVTLNLVGDTARKKTLDVFLQIPHSSLAYQTAESTAEEVHDFSTDGGGASHNDSDTPTQRVLNLIEHDPVPHRISPYDTSGWMEKRRNGMGCI